MAAFDLRLQDATFDEIATKLKEEGLASPKYTAREAWGDVDAELQRQRDLRDPSREVYREMETQRLERMRSRVVANAEDGDLFSMDRWMGLHDRITKIQGLPKPAEQGPPQGIELTGAGGGPIQSETRLDVSRLSLEELTLLESLLTKITSHPGGSQSGDSAEAGPPAPEVLPAHPDA